MPYMPFSCCVVDGTGRSDCEDISDDDVDFIYSTVRARLDAVDVSTDPVATWVRLFGDVVSRRSWV